MTRVQSAIEMRQLDQRISIRGFGSRSNFGVRGIKILLDGVPRRLGRDGHV